MSTEKQTESNPDREYDEAAEAAIIEEMNEHDARTERMLERADREHDERRDRKWEAEQEEKRTAEAGKAGAL